MSDINLKDYNLRYCKHCGGPLLNGKCTKCGITAFSWQKTLIILLSLTCILLFSSFMKVSNELYNINQEFRTRFDEYTNPITGEQITNAQSYLDAIDAQTYLESQTE